MAIEKVVNINIKDNANDVEKDINSLNQAGKKLDNTFKDVNATFEDVYGELKPLTARLGEAEDRLYELALAGQQNTKEYQELLKATANYRKVQIQTDLVVDSAAQTMSQKLGGALEGAASGFALVQGAMGLFGSESEEVEKALLKVQSAMALAQGIEGVRTAIPLIKNLGSTAITALKGIQKGIAATGIGLFVVAAGTLVAYWDDIKQAVTGVNEAQEKLIADASKLALVENEKLNDISKQENLLRLQGKTEKQILEIKLKQIDATIAATEAELKAQTAADKAQLQRVEANNKTLKQVARIGLEISSAMLRTLATPIDLVLKTINEASDFIGLGKVTDFNVNKAITDLNKYGSETVANFLFDVDSVKKETEERAKEMNKTIMDLKNQRAGTLLEIRKINKAESDDRAKTAKEIADKEAEIERQRLQNLKKLKDEFYTELEQVETEYYDNKLSKEEQEIRAVQDKFFRLKELASQYGEDTSTLLEAQLSQEKEIRDRYEKERIDKQKEIDKENLAKAKELESQKIDAISNTFNTISDLSKLFEGQNSEQQQRAFKVQKAANTANALIDTYKSATGAYASLSAVPVIGPALGAAAAGAAIAAGLANVKAIQSQKFSASGSSGGAGGPSVPNVSGNTSTQQLSTPNFNVVGASGISQTENLKPVKAYVVSGEVTSAQALDRNRIQNATF